MREHKFFISVVVPALNEAQGIMQTLGPLSELPGVEIIVVDGGSDDETLSKAAPFAHSLIHSEKGRARQMNTGAKVARGKFIIFLHADTCLPENFLECLRAVDHSEKSWGFFAVRFNTDHWLLRWVARFMNFRSRISSVATGDQAIFVRRDLWLELKGFSEMPLMEDVEFCKRARRKSPPFVVTERLTTSSRRWKQYGVVSTILLMWRLRLLYFLGVKAEILARAYR